MVHAYRIIIVRLKKRIHWIITYFNLVFSSFFFIYSTNAGITWQL